MTDQKREVEEQPPILPGWNAWYALVLGVLVAMIILFTWLTHIFS